MKKQILTALVCFGVAGGALAEEGKNVQKLPTLPWNEVPKVYVEKDKGQKEAPTRELTVTWQPGDRWTVEVFSKDVTKKTAVQKWLPTGERFRFEVTGTEVRDGEEIARIVVTREGESGATTEILVNGISHAVLATVADGKETPVARVQDLDIPWEVPAGKIKGKAFESPLGVPRDAVIFSEGVVGFPATDVPQSSGKVVDVDTRTTGGDDCFQRWDEAFPRFPLCSFSLDRVVLLREAGRN